MDTRFFRERGYVNISRGLMMKVKYSLWNYRKTHIMFLWDICAKTGSISKRDCRKWEEISWGSI